VKISAASVRQEMNTVRGKNEKTSNIVNMLKKELKKPRTRVCSDKKFQNNNPHVQTTTIFSVDNPLSEMDFSKGRI